MCIGFLRAMSLALKLQSRIHFWHADAPLEVSLLAWRLLQNRLPTKDNLCYRGVIDADSQLCVTRCGNLKTTTHLFLHCNFYGLLWYSVT